MIRARRPPPDMRAAELIERIDLATARTVVEQAALRTPAIPCPDLDALAGGPVLLKAEGLQLTGWFKFRAVPSRVAALGDPADAGLLTASAGNHARAVAEAARRRG